METVIGLILLILFIWSVYRMTRVRRIPQQHRGQHITRRDDLSHHHRARGYGVPYEPIDLVSVFIRDGWTCRLCGDHINPNAVYPDPRMPSLDHRIPLSHPRSPGHVWGNVQASHLKCNLRKGARF